MVCEAQGGQELHQRDARASLIHGADRCFIRPVRGGAADLDTDDCLAAIGADVLAGDRVGFPAREPGNGVGNLLRPDLTFQRHAGNDLVEDFG